jgi:hypothetical protein
LVWISFVVEPESADYISHGWNFSNAEFECRSPKPGQILEDEASVMALKHPRDSEKCLLQLLVPTGIAVSLLI